MSYFDKQVKKKKRYEDRMFSDAYQGLVDVVTGYRIWEDLGDDSAVLRNALKGVARCLNIKMPDMDIQTEDITELLENYFRPQGIMWREVTLTDDWYENATGVMLGTTVNGENTALIPGRLSGYTYTNPKDGKRKKITRAEAGQFEPTALLFYKSLPQRELKVSDIIRFMLSFVSMNEVLVFIAATFIVILMGMVTPAMTRFLMSDVINSSDVSVLITVTLMLLLATAAVFVFTVIKQGISILLSTKITIPLQAAFMMRTLNAPVDELKNFAAGDLGQRIGSMYNIVKNILDMSLSTILTSLCSFVCIIQMYIFSPKLAAVASLIIAVIVYFNYEAVKILYHTKTDMMAGKAMESGITYSLIDGINKITITGASKRAFSKWASVYKNAVEKTYNPPLLAKIYKILTPVILLTGTALIYLVAFMTDIKMPEYYSFIASFSIVTASLQTLSGTVDTLAGTISLFNVLEPVMKFIPETEGDKEIVHSLKGDIQIQNLYFKYDDELPPVLDDLTLNIRRGEYVAIVGTTGCGKTTLMKLLLGFEKPKRGEIFYDGKPLSSLDKSSLRKHIGTVLQNGELMQGSIHANITLAGNGITSEEAWEAAEIAGVADDIRKMPLEMNTVVLPGGKGFSGGQKQRILIARAIATKPAVIFFDEATSALDNITQKAVSDAIGKMKCTRIIIAHRLSTIIDCDRIIYLDKGHVVEEGTYDELIAKNGAFAELVRRQQL